MKNFFYEWWFVLNIMCKVSISYAGHKQYSKWLFENGGHSVAILRVTLGSNVTFERIKWLLRINWRPFRPSDGSCSVIHMCREHYRMALNCVKINVWDIPFWLPWIQLVYECAHMLIELPKNMSFSKYWLINKHFYPHSSPSTQTIIYFRINIRW